MSSGNPPGDFPFFDLSGLLGGLGNRDPWQSAAELAATIASDQGSEPNLDPIDRMRVEELGRVAELQLGRAVGVSLQAKAPSAPAIISTRGYFILTLLIRDLWPSNLARTVPRVVTRGTGTV